MEQNHHDKNVREGNHNHPTREGRREDRLQGTSPQAADEFNMTESRRERLDQDGSLSSLPKGQRRRDPECPEEEQSKNVNQDIPPQNKPQVKWEEGLNKDGNSDEGSQKEKEDMLPHEEDDHAQAIPCLALIVDRGYYRETVYYWADWDDVMFKFLKDWGVEEEEYYDSSEEEYNDDYEAVGPCRNDFGHVGPDKADLQFEYHYGEDSKEGDIVGVREDFRNCGMPPFLSA